MIIKDFVMLSEAKKDDLSFGLPFRHGEQQR